MKATIITIGDEILIGQIVDTNSVSIARRLNNIGRLKEISLSYDLPKKAVEAIRLSSLSFKLQATNLALLYADKRLNGQDPEFFNSGGVAVPMPKQFTLTCRIGF